MELPKSHFKMINNKKLALISLQKQLKRTIQLCQNNKFGFFCSVGLVDENDFFKWRLFFQGPENTSYEGGYYNATLTFPEEFPYQPPKMTFTTEMFHPNIYHNGDVCISILHPPIEDPHNPQEKISEKWNPSLSIESILVSVASMLDSPNLDSPANIDAAVLLRKDKNKYEATIKLLARKSTGD